MPDHGSVVIVTHLHDLQAAEVLPGRVNRVLLEELQVRVREHDVEADYARMMASADSDSQRETLLRAVNTRH